VTMSAEAITLLAVVCFAGGMLAYHLWIVGRIGTGNTTPGRWPGAITGSGRADGSTIARVMIGSQMMAPGMGFPRRV